MKHGARLFYAIAATLGAVAACSSAGGDDDDSKFAPGDNGNGNGFGGTTNINPGGGGTQQQPQPEQEVDHAFRVPVVSGHWVWTANARSGRVALIDAKTFTVKTALAGAGPTYLAALPAEEGASRAIVINSESQDATLFDATAEGEVTTSATLPLHAGANAWAVTADGRFAIAWTDSSLLKKPDPSEGFQDITVLDLGGKAPTSKRLSVGYRPARIFLDDDDRYAYVVTDAGIDVVDLKSDDGAVVEREVELSANPASDTASREVNLTPDGAWAFVRRENKDYITVVDVAHGVFKDITLPGVITDLDLSADASMAVAVIREKVLPADTSAAGAGTGGQAGQAQGGSEGGADSGSAGGGGGGLDDAGGAGASNVAQGGTSPGPEPEHGSLAVLLPVASIFATPDLFDSVRIDDVFGSVDLGAKAQTALLFSNGVPSTHLTLLSLLPGDAFKHRTLDLKLPVFTAVSTPDGAHAIAILRPQAGSKQPGAFAVVPVAKNLPAKIQGTQAATVPSDLALLAPAMVAIDDTRALVTVSDGASASFSYLVSMPELTVDPIALDSVPLPQASGIVREANQAFVAQQHPEGRITFIDLNTHELHTLTGFELATQVGK